MWNSVLKVQTLDSDCRMFIVASTVYRLDYRIMALFLYLKKKIENKSFKIRLTTAEFSITYSASTTGFVYLFVSIANLSNQSIDRAWFILKSAK